MISGAVAALVWKVQFYHFTSETTPGLVHQCLGAPEGGMFWEGSYAVSPAINWILIVCVAGWWVGQQIFKFLQ